MVWAVIALFILCIVMWVDIRALKREYKELDLILEALLNKHNRLCESMQEYQEEELRRSNTIRKGIAELKKLFDALNMFKNDSI